MPGSFTQGGRSHTRMGKEELGIPVYQCLTPVHYPQAPVWPRQTLQPTSPFSPPTTPPVVYCIPTTPACRLSPKHNGIFLRPCLRSSHALSLELPALIPCLPRPTPPLVLSSQASLWGGLLLPERSLARWHSSLLGPAGTLPWWSVGCPPICFPSLPPKGRSVLRARLRMREFTSVAAPALPSTWSNALQHTEDPPKALTT